MSQERDLETIRFLLNKEGVSYEAKIGTFSTGGDVMRGPIIVGDFDQTALQKIQSYLELADYLPRVRPLSLNGRTVRPLRDERTGVVVAGDGVLMGYVGDYDGEIDYEF